MDPTFDLREATKEVIAKFARKHPHNLEDMQKVYLPRFAEATIREFCDRYLQSTPIADSLIETLANEISEKNPKSSDNPYYHYEQAVAELNQIRDELLQIDRAHNRQHLRTMIYRIATSLGVAATILIAYYIGWKIGIPLPLRMGV